MKTNYLYLLLCLVIGAAIGAGVTYETVKCKTSGVDIRLGGGKNPGLSITNTGNDN